MRDQGESGIRRAHPTIAGSAEEEGAMSQGMWVASRTGQGREMNSPPVPPEGKAAQPRL